MCIWSTAVRAKAALDADSGLSEEWELFHNYNKRVNALATDTKKMVDLRDAQLRQKGFSALLRCGSIPSKRALRVFRLKCAKIGAQEAAFRVLDTEDFDFFEKAGVLQTIEEQTCAKSHGSV